MRKSLVIILYVLLLPWTAFSQTNADSLLTVLKREIGRKNFYDRQKDAQIKVLIQRLKVSAGSDLAKEYKATEDLFNVYRDYRFDSTFYYAQRLVDISAKLKDTRKINNDRLRLGNTLITAGMFKETFDCLRGVDPSTLDRDLKKFYYILMSWSWSDLSKYNADRFYAPEDLVRKYRYLDSAIALTKEGSFEQIILQAQQRPGVGPPPIFYYTKLLKRKLSKHEQAMVITGLSQYRSGTEKIGLLASAAINDIRTSTYRAQALSDLGKALYAYGRVDEAYFFVQQAMAQTDRFGARMQRFEVSRLLSVISTKRDIIAEHERERFLIILLVIVAVAIFIALICFIIFVQLKKVRAGERIIVENNRLLALTNSKLWEEAHIKEEYIGFFFSELSRHILKLDKLKNNVLRKAKTGTVEDVIRVVDKIDVSAERTALYHTFDKVFLKLFPDFVEAVNSMLREEDRLKPKIPGTLNTHLRIFALMRLGISDNEAIAAILEYSVTTVYTYRFRLRSKALVPADEFEQRIMGIRLSVEPPQIS